MRIHALLLGSTVILALFALLYPQSQQKDSSRSAESRGVYPTEPEKFLRSGDFPHWMMMPHSRQNYDGVRLDSAVFGREKETAGILAVEFQVQQMRGRGVPAFVEEFLCCSMPVRADPIAG